MLLNNRVDDPESLHGGVDIVNAEDGCAAQGARNYASDRPGVSIRRVGDLKDVPDHCFSGDREQNWAFEACEQFQVSIDTQVVFLLFREIDSRIENDRFARDARTKRLIDLRFKKTVKRTENVGVLNIRVALFR